MIEPEFISNLQNSTCAIAYVTVPIEKYIVDPNQPFLKVIGTGFLVTADSVMTNRHVIQGILEAQANFGFPIDQRVLMFVQPSKPGRFKIHIANILEMVYVRNAEVDVGFIKFKRPDVQEFDSVKPLPFQAQGDFSITEHVVICGYPFGSAMLKKGNKVYRWGPVLQQGYISAISPFVNTNQPNELLLDIRIAPGMSGSAVIRATDGFVIGIVHSNWEDTTAVAFPLDSSKIDRWIRDYDTQKELAAIHSVHKTGLPPR